MAELNKSKKQTINVNTYRFASGQTIDEILKLQTSWATDEQCLLNMIDSDWRAVEDFITEKEKELAKRFQAAANNPVTDLKLLAVQSDVATQFLCQKHTNQELWEKARNDQKGMTRPYSKDVVNIENQINFPYELPSWIKNSIEEIPSNWFEKTPQQLQEEQEKEENLTTQAAVSTGLSYKEWEDKNSNKSLEDELDNLKQTLQEKDKELDIWTAKAEADNKTIQNLNKQLEQEKAYHTSSCVITVPQRDSNGNEIIGKDGKPLTAKLNCTEGVDAALGKLSRKCVDLTLENQRLQEELDKVNNRNSNSQSDNSSWSD